MSQKSNGNKTVSKGQQKDPGALRDYGMGDSCTLSPLKNIGNEYATGDMNGVIHRMMNQFYQTMRSNDSKSKSSQYVNLA